MPNHQRPELPYKLHPECAAWDYDPARVAKYEARLRDGEDPPPITMHEGMVLDGAHRLEAWIRVWPHALPPLEHLPAGVDPAVFVHLRHLGTRESSLKQKVEHIHARMAATGATLEACLALFPVEHRAALKGRYYLAYPAAAPPKPPKVAKIHMSPGAAPEVDTIVRAIIPDSHGEHIDLGARDAFLSDLQALDVHEIVMLGDHLDAGGTMSTHQKSYSHEKTESYQDDVTAANVFLDKIQRASPRAVIHYLEGNHEQHVERWAVREFERKKDADMVLEAIGPAAVLNLKKRGIAYYQRSTAYMNLSIPGAIKLGECYFVHGVSHAKNADQAHLERFGANVVFGHVHRVQGMNSRTVTSSGFGSWCPGTLAKLQPLYAHTAPTTWNHGYGLQFVAKSGAFLHINVPIHKGESLLRLTGMFAKMKS